MHTAIDAPWTAERQREYMLAQPPRECIHVAELAPGELLGYQTLELYAASIPSMAHVGQLGTFLRAGARRHGIGRALFAATEAFALAHDYRKFVVQVRASNSAALGFYRALGFEQCGRYTAHVIIDGAVEDEVLMERLMAPGDGAIMYDRAL